MDADTTLARLNTMTSDTLMETLGIEFTDAGEDFLVARMPVGPRVHQPMGLLHGGASAALAETVASAASALRIDPDRQGVVGLDLSISHVRALRTGWISGRADAVHLGQRTHVWSIDIRDQRDRRVALARLTSLVVEQDSLGG